MDSNPKLANIIPNAQLHPTAIDTNITSPFDAPATNADPFAIHSNVVKELHASIL